MSDANRYAAAVLRNLQDRIDKLEQQVAEEGVPNIIRQARDTMTSTDSATVSVTNGATFSWDTASANAVNLSWTDNATTEDRYNVYVATGPSPTFPGDYALVERLPLNTTTFTDATPPASTSTTYAVTAENASGESVEDTVTLDTSGGGGAWGGSGLWG